MIAFTNSSWHQPLSLPGAWPPRILWFSRPPWFGRRLAPGHLSDKGLLASKDKGLTWNVQGTPVPDKTAWVGPYIGKDEKHIFVVGKEGVQETTDGGQTWKVVAPLPKPIAEKEFKRTWGNGPCLGYDPKRDTIYISFPGSPMFRYQR